MSETPKIRQAPHAEAPGLFKAKKSVMEVLASLRSDPHQPLSAMVEIADRCNEACVHCYQVQGQKGELTTDEWKRIFDELAELGVFLLTISGGEATLRKDFLELVAYARHKRFAVKVYTNGLRVTETMARSLAELAVQEVQISLYAYHAAAHDEITRVPGSFDRTLAAAKHLRAAGVSVVLKTPLMTSNVDDIDEYIQLVRSVGADYSFDLVIEPREDGDASPEALRIDDASHLAALRHPALARKPEPGRTRSPKESVCGACSGAVHIEANGELRPCTQLQVPVGHALEDGVREAWKNNPEGTAIREITWGDLHGCRDCALMPQCGRCFAQARVEASDALAPYPSACRRAKLTYAIFEGVEPSIREGERPDLEMGPYRRVGPHEFETALDRMTPEDRVRQAEQTWVRPPERLVQLRRRSARTPSVALDPKGPPK